MNKMHQREPKKKIDKLVKILKAYDPEKIYLFGSWARGEADALSDIDLVLIKKTETSFFERLKHVYKLLPENSGSVDVLVYTPVEFAKMQQQGNAFIEMILEEGKLIYGR